VTTYAEINVRWLKIVKNVQFRLCTSKDGTKQRLTSRESRPPKNRPRELNRRVADVLDQNPTLTCNRVAEIINETFGTKTSGSSVRQTPAWEKNRNK